MKKKVLSKTILENQLNQVQKPKQRQSDLSDKYFTIFEHVPIALWVEDFSKTKLYIDKVVKENNTDVQTYLQNNPAVISKLAAMVVIKDVNTTAVKLYNAKDKANLLENLTTVFTEKSNIGFGELIVDILLGKTETETESVNKTLDGKEFDILIKFNVMDGSEETLDNVIVSIENITDKIKEKEKLLTSEKRYKEAQEIAKIGSWYYDFSLNKTHWSDEIYSLLGAKPHNENLSLDLYLSYVHTDDKKLVNNFSIDFLLKNPNQNLQYRIFTERGDLKHITEKRSVVIENGRIKKIIGIFQDITENILFEEKLNTTKNLFSNTLSSINDGFVIIDDNSNYLYINEVAANLLDIKNIQSLIGKNMWSEFPETEGELFFDNFQHALKTREPQSFESYFKPWNRWFKNRIIPSDEGMMLFFHEITDKKASENKIKEAYNIINKSSSIAFLCKNERDFPIQFVSENVLDLFGYTNIEFLSNKINLFKIAHPTDLKYMNNEFLKLGKSKHANSVKPKPFRIITKNGEVKWLRSSLDAIKNEQNEITHIQGIVEDITEQKNTEDLLFESNQRLKDQFNNTPLASIMWDLDFKILEWNNAAEHIFGYTAKEVKGKESRDLLTPPHLLEEMKNLRKFKFNQKETFINTNENITKDGKIITCVWYCVTLKDAKGNIIGSACLVDDITDEINTKKLLQKSEKKYRDLFEKSVDTVLIIRDGLFVDCNQSALKMFGYLDKKELLPLHPSKISPETQTSGESSFIKAERMMNIALEKGSNRFRWDHQQKNGRVFTSEVSLTRIDESNSKPTIHAVVKDITDRVKNEALENVLYNISKAALTINDFNVFSLFVKTELHKIVDTRNLFIALYNAENNMISTQITVYDKQENFEFSAKKSLTGYVMRTKKPIMITKEDHLKLIETNEAELIGEFAKIWIGVPLKIQDKVFGAIVIQSFEDENAFSENDVNLLEFVADQISTTIQRKKIEEDLKNALTKAQESDKLKSSFLANMSHEIRTPMNGIIGFSELFLESDLSDKERKKYAKIVVNSGKQLLTIVNDILDISKIEAGVVELHYESINLNKLLDNLFSFYKQKAIESNLKLSCVKGLDNFKSFIKIDKTKLNQVLTNLLSNAFKFTDEGSIEFGYELLENNLQFYVKDTGVGISENLQNKIFDRFIQANQNLNKKLQGTGLGLAISKKFIELFKGEIWLDSTNKGSTIYFTIPYVKSKTSVISTVIDAQKSSTHIKEQKLTILVAEDEAYNMMYINELFSKTNFNVLEACNGKIAVELTQKHPEIAMVLMDIKMPVMDGNAAMKEIKKEKPTLPIIALSAFAMESDKKEALNNGFDAYLTKPIDKKLLFEIIGKYAN